MRKMLTFYIYLVIVTTVCLVTLSTHRKGCRSSQLPDPEFYIPKLCRVKGIPCQQMASIHCKCGEVQIKFTSQCPRVAVECCDKKAFNNIKFLAKIGEYEIPDKFPVLVYYFDNSLVVVKGIEKLFFYKLIVEANKVGMYTSCCHTFLMSLNPVFAPSTILVHGDRSHLSNIAHQKPTLRFFGDQLTEEERKQLIHDIPDLCREANASLKGDRDGWEEVYRDFLGKVSAPIAGNQEGQSFEEILQQRSEPIFVFGWQSHRFARKTVALHECTLSE